VFRGQGQEFGGPGSGFRVPGFRVQGSGSRVRGPGFGNRPSQCASLLSLFPLMHRPKWLWCWHARLTACARPGHGPAGLTKAPRRGSPKRHAISTSCPRHRWGRDREGEVGAVRRPNASRPRSRSRSPCLLRGCNWFWWQGPPQTHPGAARHPSPSFAEATEGRQEGIRSESPLEGGDRAAVRGVEHARIRGVPSEPITPLLRRKRNKGLTAAPGRGVLSGSAELLSYAD
jgi:hypothetical protein